MVDREVVESFCKIAKKMVLAREEARKLVDTNTITYDQYDKIRNPIGDCLLKMATICDCAPIRLISGDVDSIMSNFDEQSDIKEINNRVELLEQRIQDYAPVLENRVEDLEKKFEKVIEFINKFFNTELIEDNTIYKVPF
jgi:hypothetical protein